MPDHQGLLTDDEKDRVFTFLRDNNVVCPINNKQDWQLHTKLLLMPAFGGADDNVQFTESVAFVWVFEAVTSYSLFFPASQFGMSVNV